MELLDTDDPIKSALLSKTARHREELEEETRAIAERTEKIITNAVIIGGALALTYFAYTQLSGSKKKKKVKLAKERVSESEIEEDDEPSKASAILSQVGTALVTQGGALLLSIAKEKLVDYLRAQAEKKEHENS
jgi:plasmid stability protein